MRFFWLFLLFSQTLFALYNGNPTFPMMPESGVWINKEVPLGLKTGYELDWVYGCRLHQNLHHFSEKKSRSFESLSQLGVLTINFNDRVELFGDAGELSCHWNHAFAARERLSYEGRSSLAWGVGGRALLAYWGDLQVAMNAAYLSSRPPLSQLKVNGASQKCRGAKINLAPWQIGAGVSYRLGWFVPYLGVDYMKLIVKVRHLRSIAALIPKGKIDFQNENPFGIFCGMGLGLDRGVNLNLEWRLIQENGCSVSADFKF